MSHGTSTDRESTTPTPQRSLSVSDGKASDQPTRRKIKVEITSDAICKLPSAPLLYLASSSPLPGPFCILGLRYLQQAIATAQSSDPSSPLAHLDFELEFKPFLLDPTLTREPIDKREKYEARFGKDKFAQMEAVMQKRAKSCGLNL